MLWIHIAAAAPHVIASTVDEGPLSERLSDAPTDLVVVYGGEQNGAIGTCGCPGNPRGSLGRVHGWLTALRDRGTPYVAVNAGNWLTDPVGPDNGLHPSASPRNAIMMEAMDGWDALNVSFRDLPWLARQPAAPAEAISANTGGLPAYRLVERGGVTVALTGVTAWKKDYLQPDDVERPDPVVALTALLPTLREQADLVVVTSYGLGRRNRALAALDIDVLIDADTHRTRADPLVVDGTVWVRSRYETQVLGELRLDLGPDGIEVAHDRAISLDEKIPTAKGWRRREKQARRALEAL